MNIELENASEVKISFIQNPNLYAELSECNMEDKIITHTQTENTSGLCLFCTDEKKEIKIKVNDDSKYEKYNICEV